jgi:parvulin-like peptidyl-prolyl isomerase
MLRTEEQARDRAEVLRQRLLGGADFAQLAAAYSDDPALAKRRGQWTSMDRSSPYPEAIKQAVFALKPGEISRPVRQANGFYVLKLESIQQQPFGKVRPAISSDVRQAHFNDLFQQIKARFAVHVLDDSFFANPPEPL